MCVEVDLTKKLVPAIKVRGLTLKVEYEGLHLVCFSCGRYGHRQELQGQPCNASCNGTTFWKGLFSFVLNYVTREANCLADSFAKFGLSNHCNNVIFLSIPSFALEVLEGDLAALAVSFQ